MKYSENSGCSVEHKILEGDRARKERGNPSDALAATRMRDYGLTGISGGGVKGRSGYSLQESRASGNPL